MALFHTALQALDRADLAAAQIKSEGLTVTTTATGVSHVSPLLKVEQQSRALFARIFQQLNLEREPDYFDYKANQ